VVECQEDEGSWGRSILIYRQPASFSTFWKVAIKEPVNGQMPLTSLIDIFVTAPELLLEMCEYLLQSLCLAPKIK
jgi:hypothetical protein